MKPTLDQVSSGGYKYIHPSDIENYMNELTKTGDAMVETTANYHSKVLDDSENVKECVDSMVIALNLWY